MHPANCRGRRAATAPTAKAAAHDGGTVIRALDHLQLAMPPGGEEQAVSFYQAVLGLRFASGPPHLARAGGCWFEADAVRVHLSVEHFHPARKGYAALLVDDLPALVGALTAARRPVIVDETLDGCTRVYVKDPFGNRIELFEEPARSPDPERL